MHERYKTNTNKSDPSTHPSYSHDMKGIWKHPKTANWIARFRGANGKWVNRSTGTPEVKEAQRVASQWKVEAERERARKTAEISPSGISDTVARAERLARVGRLDAHAARDLINNLLTAAGQETLDAITNRAWCETWLASKAGSVKDCSNDKYDQVSRDWLTFLNGKAEKALETVTRMEAIAYRDTLAKDGLAPGTVNHTIKLLRGIYGEAVEQGYIGRNPFSGIDVLRKNREDAQRQPFTSAEVSTIIETAEGDWKGMIILAATSGLRLMDVATLKWRNIDSEFTLIQITTAKTGAVLKLPVHPDFASWLKNQTRGIGVAPVFPTLADKGGSGKSGLSMAFKRLMERSKVSSGVARQAKKQGRGRTTSQKSFHSLRHFAATQFAANGVRADVARAITGHADAKTHSNYVTADLETLRGAVEAIHLSA
jgi:integrase